MSNSIQPLLNNIIQDTIPEINSGIQNAIKSGHLDPWGQVAHGNNTLGTIDLGICNASAVANYNVNNMKELSTISIDTLEVTSVHQGQNDTQFIGSLNMSASLSSSLSANIGGVVEAQCGFVHPHVGINGEAFVASTDANASGALTASIKGGEVCIDSIVISNVSVNFDDIQVHINGLGIFNSLERLLTNIIVGVFESQIRNAIASALTPIMNTQLQKVTSKCLTMS